MTSMMATDCSSQASSLAPIDFNLSSSLEESHGAISVAVEKCQLCGGTRRPFFCKNCIRRGEFSHSGAVRSERYTEKLERWHALKKERLKLLKQIEVAVKDKDNTEKKRHAVREAQDMVHLLQRGVQVEKTARDSAGQKLAAVREANETRRQKAIRHHEKKRRIARYIEQISHFVVQQQLKLEQHQQDIFYHRKQHVSDLMVHLFPITQVQPSSETESMQLSTVSALAEARRTSYIRGRWVYTDNGGEHQYSIIEPHLPGAGDYSQYSLWVQENQETVRGPHSHMEQRNPAYTISAGLAYITQLLSLLAYFLDINLPKRLCYSEFCGHELSESKLNGVVRRLNYNVLQLCFTQQVDPELLHPRHTIHNILMLLQAQQLGRTGPFEVSPELVQSLEEGASSEEGWSTEEEEEEETEIQERDWEHVPVTLPELDLVTALEPYQSTSPSRPVEGMAPAGGLMSSAAASVASLWRAATSRMEK